MKTEVQPLLGDTAAARAFRIGDLSRRADHFKTAAGVYARCGAGQRGFRAFIQRLRARYYVQAYAQAVSEMERVRLGL